MARALQYFAPLMACAVLFGGQAWAQRLDANDCNNGVYHIEDGFNSIKHMAVVFNAPQKSYCYIRNGTRSCESGPEMVANFRKDLRNYNIKNWRVTRMALMPELIGEAKFACRKTGNTFKLGIAVERYFDTKDNKSIRDLNFMTVEYLPVANGNISILNYTAYDFNDLSSAVKNAGNPFKRRQFVFDRTYGNSRKVYAAGTVEGGARVRGGAVGQGKASGGGVFTVSGSGSSGLMSSRTAASQAARASALSSARSACRSSGGSVISSSAGAGTARKVTDTKYRGTATATAKCRRKVK